MFGRVRMYEAGFLVFILGSALCALAWNEPSIIGFRIVQGIGGAFVTANSGAVIADLSRGRSAGGPTATTRSAGASGPFSASCWAALIVTYVSWRWIFWINVPIGLAAVALALRVLRDQGERASRTVSTCSAWPRSASGLFGVLWAMTKLATVAAATPRSSAS